MYQSEISRYVHENIREKNYEGAQIVVDSGKRRDIETACHGDVDMSNHSF